ncbi:Formin-like protein 1 [Auxenochlorella protothecoides]|uniref:Formin-like protein n=1 Tax=Auxenochlorella protothecoides TaxID=3075 RepID=A0A087SNM9_AUXPR|nr:Formin-like protein 1 [Auxenochlorella protothecoides]KFM27333.1 Formin-like protein 1 [Auxenochlorella protothecoides]
MDSVAVSVLVIKSLAALRTPLVDPGSCQQLLGLAFSRDGPQVKLSCLTQIMGSRSGVHHDLLRRLVRYCKRLVSVPGAACTRKGLARTLGPPLLQPELSMQATDPRQLTQAAIWVTAQMIETKAASDWLLAAHYTPQPSASAASSSQGHPAGAPSGEPASQRTPGSNSASGGSCLARGSRAGTPPGCLGREAGGGTPRGSAPNIDLHPILLRQQELKAALRPPAPEGPDKSPWRPPGPNARVAKRSTRAPRTPRHCPALEVLPRTARSQESVGTVLGPALALQSAGPGPVAASPARGLGPLQAAVARSSGAESGPGSPVAAHTKSPGLFRGFGTAMGSLFGGLLGRQASAGKQGRGCDARGAHDGAQRDGVDGEPGVGEASLGSLSSSSILDSTADHAPDAHHHDAEEEVSGGRRPPCASSGRPRPADGKAPANSAARGNGGYADRARARDGARHPHARAGEPAGGDSPAPGEAQGGVAAAALPGLGGGLYVHAETGAVVQKTEGGDGVTAFLPAGLSLDDLLQAAEDMQRHLPSPGGEGPPGGGFAGDDAPNAYTPLDLASLLAAHAHRLRQESEKRQALRAAEEVLASRLGLPGPGGDGVAKTLSLSPEAPTSGAKTTEGAPVTDENAPVNTSAGAIGPQGGTREAVQQQLAQKLRLKQLHWDKLKAAGEGTVWRLAREQHLSMNFEELEALFQILENNALKKLTSGAKSDEVRLVEHRRAHNICIELSGIRRPFADIKAALVSMDAGALSVEQLSALSRAVPDDSERRDLELYLQGSHPKHRGVSDPDRLGTVERYFLEIKDIPRLAQRIRCLIFSRTYASTAGLCEDHLGIMQSACSQLQTCPGLTQLLTAVLELGNHLNAGTHRGAAAGFRLDTLLKLADVKGVDRKTSLLHFVVRQLAAQGDIVVQLPAQLSAVRPAAAMQLTSIRGMIDELRAGLRGVTEEIMHAARAGHASCAAESVHGEEDAAGCRRFSELMAAFHVDAATRFCALEAQEKAMYEDLHQVADYFGEAFKETDPAHVVHVVRDFVLLFEKVVREMKVSEEAAATAAKQRAAMTRKKGNAERALGTPRGAKGKTQSAAVPEQLLEIEAAPGQVEVEQVVSAMVQTVAERAADGVEYGVAGEPATMTELGKVDEATEAPEAAEAAKMAGAALASGSQDSAGAEIVDPPALEDPDAPCQAADQDLPVIVALLSTNEEVPGTEQRAQPCGEGWESFDEDIFSNLEARLLSDGEDNSV